MTVYIAGGNYDSSAAQAVSGSSGQPVTYKAATKANHGTATGWSDGYAVDGGAGQAVLRGGFNVEWNSKRSFITLDGQVRSSLTAGHGFHCVKGYAGDRAAVFAGGQVDDLTIRYCELGDETQEDYCIDGIQGKGHRLMVELNFIHDCDNRGDAHGDGIQWFFGDGCTFRYNLFRHCGQHLYTGDSGAPGATNFVVAFNQFDNKDSGSGGSAGWAINAGGPTEWNMEVRNWRVFNNTISFSSSLWYPIYPNGAMANLLLKNNVFLDNDCYVVKDTTHSYNGWDNSCKSAPDEPGKVTGDLKAGFENAAGFDFRLKSTSLLRGKATATDLGYTKDILGNPVGNDIGAFQFV
jgi:hypothetical protein